MGDPNAILRAEHEAIEHLVSAIEGMAARLGGTGPYPRNDLDTALTVAAEFADRCHHAKEEKVLFPALAAASPKTGAELTRRLTSDHIAFRKLVGSMRDQIASGGRDVDVRTQLAKNLGTFSRMLRRHISVEDLDLAREVERFLGPAERERIAEAFERAEREEVGPGVREKYHAMIHQLAALYGH